MGTVSLQQVTASYRVVYCKVTAGSRMLPIVYSGLQQVSAGYRVVIVGYSRLQQVTEWIQWVTAGYCRLPSGYSGLQ